MTTLVPKLSQIDSIIVQHGAKMGSGRLVRHKSGQEAILDQYADHYADPWGRFGRPIGVMLGLMLGLCWHLFS